MSTRRRKLGFHSIEFLFGKEREFDGDMFADFLSFVSQLPDSEKLLNDQKNNRAIAIQNIREDIYNGKKYFKIIFKTCKYNHSPDYMSSVDGSERPTDKRLHEGDRELTHLCIRVDNDEGYSVLEERKNGITMGGIVSYLNRLFFEYAKRVNMAEGRSLVSYLIPHDNFLEELKRMEKISIAEIFVDRRTLGSDFRELATLDEDCQDIYEMRIKALKGKSLKKAPFERLFNRLASEATTTKRIRLRGKDIDGMSVMIDSLKQKKIEEVEVDLRRDGTVDSYSLFALIDEILGVNE